MQIMSTLKSSMAKLSLSAALCVTLAAPAFALDGAVLQERITDLAKSNNLNITSDNVTVDGTTVTLEGVKIAPLEAKKGSDEKLPIGKITLTNVQEGSDGSYTADKLVVDDIDIKDGADTNPSQLVIQGLEANNLYLAAKDAPYRPSQHLPYQNAKIKKINFTVNDKNVFVIDNAYVDYPDYQPGKPIKTEAAIDNMMIDFKSMPENDAQKTMMAMGYDKVEGNLQFNGLWDTTSGDMEISKYNIVMKDGGNLSINAKIGGITEEFADELRKVQERMNGGSQADQQAAGLAALGLLQQLTVTSLKIRFDDDSLTNRALDYNAKKNDMSRDDLIKQTKMILPLLAAQIQHQAFAEKLTTEVGSYLDKPESLEIAASPENKVAFAEILAAAAVEPQRLIDILKVSISANN